MRSKPIGVTSLIFQVTWRHRSRDHLIPRMPFSIGIPLDPTIYLLTISEISNGKCEAMVDMALNDL